MQQNEFLHKLKHLLEQQINDDALWFEAEYTTEAYLQKALRKLHAAIEVYVFNDDNPINGMYLNATE